ncbi:MAG: metallophosphoesterase [Methanotrichaceae archaeon]|nr:metallophosphoesterase [Methanotrichaceae archaeon]
MTRVLALSDTHLEEGLPPGIEQMADGADLIVHAGDFVSMEVFRRLSGLGRLEAVCGNSDSPQLKKLLPSRRVIEVEEVRIGLVHRAFQGQDLVGAEMMAREMEVDVLVFGHIHKPVVEKGRKLLVCPGSPTLPRLSAPSVAILDVDGSTVAGKIIPLGRPVCDYFRYAESLAEKK